MLPDVKSKGRKNYYVGVKVSKQLVACNYLDHLVTPARIELEEVIGPAALIKEVKQQDGQWLMSDYTLKELQHQIQIGEFVVPPPSILENIISTFLK